MLRRLDEGQKEAARVERTQSTTRIANCAMLVDGLDRVSRRLDAYVAEFAIKQQQAEEEAERKDTLRIRRELDALPDPDTPENWGELGTPIPAKQELDDQEGFATRPEPDSDDLAYPRQPKQVGQPISVQLNEV
jgi:hypothetical protein